MSTLSGSQVIDFEWVPEPEAIAQKVMALAAYLEDFIPPLEASKAAARADMEKHFDSESSPYGGAWAPLAEATTKRWGEHPILQLTGALRDAATSDAAYMVDGHDLFFNTGALPPYWVFDEFGTHGAGMGKILSELKAAGHAVEEHAGGGQPPRPFVNISFEAEQQIIAIFDAWFEGGINGFYAHGGAVQTRLASGRFGPAIK